MDFPAGEFFTSFWPSRYFVSAVFYYGGLVSMAGLVSGVYQPRHPQGSLFYQVLSRHYEEFLSLYPTRFQSQYGPLRPVIEEVLQKYLACGDLARGFARIRCEHCHINPFLINIHPDIPFFGRLRHIVYWFNPRLNFGECLVITAGNLK